MMATRSLPMIADDANGLKVDDSEVVGCRGKVNLDERYARETIDNGFRDVMIACVDCSVTTNECD
jgi:hypothetical protein